MAAGTIVATHGRSWLSVPGEVIRAVRADPVILAPAILLIALAAIGAYTACRFM